MKKLVAVSVVLSFGALVWSPVEAVSPTSADIDCSETEPQGPIEVTGAVGDVFTLEETSSEWGCTLSGMQGVVAPSGPGYEANGAFGQELRFGGTATFTILGAGSFSVKTQYLSGTIVQVNVTVAGGVSLPANNVEGSFDPNGGACTFDGEVKSVTHQFSAAKLWAAPSGSECTRNGFTFKYWSLRGSTEPAGLPLDSRDGKSVYLVSVNGDYVAQWEGWVADGSQAGGGIFGGLGSSVSMSDDGNVVAGGGFFANTRVHRRSAASSTWSDAIVHDKVVGIMSTVDVSGDGSTLASTWGLWIGLPGIGDGVVRSSIPSEGSRLRLEPLPPTLGVVANPLTTRSVSMSRDGSVQAIGERSGGSTGEGLVKIRDSSGSLAEFLGEARGDGFGASVAVSADGSTVVVGAPLNDWAGSDAGSVRVYRRFGVGWFQSTIVGEAAGDNFGFSVAVSANGNTIVVGAPFNDGAGVNSGQVRVFDWKDNRWAQRGTDIDGVAIGGRAGHSVAMSSDGNSVVFGAPYASMPDWNRQRQLGTRCRYPSGGGFWDELSKFLIDIFSACDGLEGGRADVMRWASGTWTMVGQPIPGDSRRRVGFSVDMSSDGTKIVVGAPGLSTLLDLFHGGEMKEYRLTS